MGYVIRRGRRWRLSELGEPQCAVTRSVCASGVVLSVATAVNTALCENAAKRVDPKCSMAVTGGDRAAVCGCQVITLNTLDAHNGQVSLTLDKTKNVSAG